MRSSRPGKMSSLHDIAFEKERLRHLELRTELELRRQFRHTRQLFTFHNILHEMQKLVYVHLKNSVKRVFG